MWFGKKYAPVETSVEEGFSGFSSNSRTSVSFFGTTTPNFFASFLSSISNAASSGLLLARERNDLKLNPK